MMVTNNVRGDSIAVSSAFGSKLAQIQIRVYGFLFELGCQQVVQNDRKGDMTFGG